jgi:hypothetical protein
MPLAINRDGIQLVLADGTHARSLDPPRVAALLRRTEIGAGSLTYVHHTASRPATGGLSALERTRVRSEILAAPLAGGELTRSHPIEGYMVVDAKEELASLEGVLLEVIATRPTDGAFVRHTYRFPPPNDGLQASATTPEHGQ